MSLKQWARRSNSSPDYLGDLILLGLVGAIALNSLHNVLKRFSLIPQSYQEATYTLPSAISSDTEFVEKTQAIAHRLGTKPEYLFAVMHFESGGSFSPSKKNLAGSDATGLIQFMPATARGLGTSTAALARMSRIEQLDYVERYLRPFKGQLNTLIDTYMAVLYPAAVGNGGNYRLFTRGTIAYRQNAGLDSDRDGVVTAKEAAAKVSRFLPPTDRKP
ncbi:MAG: transglycosylase SLT domain-containing protein [Kastovskya adunca ATA6-11-RM4]|jgi:hypothetical protein|nr:transglycosylase SLT domain-containing protein [Kastovskya adunca ATA6-11-RM4]